MELKKGDRVWVSSDSIEDAREEKYVLIYDGMYKGKYVTKNVLAYQIWNYAVKVEEEVPSQEPYLTTEEIEIGLKWLKDFINNNK